MAYSATLTKSVGLSCGGSLRVYSLSPDAATGNFTVSDATNVTVLAVTPLIEDTAAATDNIVVEALENSTTTNQVDVKLWNAANTAASTYLDFRVVLYCK